VINDGAIQILMLSQQHGAFERGGSCDFDALLLQHPGDVQSDQRFVLNNRNVSPLSFRADMALQRRGKALFTGGRGSSWPQS